MRLLAPGSFLWLVVHDLRLSWRRFADMLGGGTPVKALAIAFAGGLVLHALAWPAIPYLTPYMAGPATGPDARVALLALIVCIASWMTAQGLFAATRTLYDRGDLDLLLGAPLSPRRVLAAKATAIALSSLGSVAMLALPIANVGALQDGPRWLAVYPALAGVVLLATALAIGATVALFRLFGPRRARLRAQMAGALIGGAFVLAAQIVAMLPEAWRVPINAALAPVPAAEMGWLSHALWLPVEALLGNAAAMAWLFGAGVAAFALVASGLGESFARASLAAAGAPSETGLAHGRPVRFRTGPSVALRHKEWRLLVRDPSLFAQLGLQIVYTIPLAVLLVRSGSLPIAVALAPAIVVIASQVAASLAWIAVSGEDAPELIASAPIPPAAVDRAKLAAIALPVAAVAAIPVVGLAFVAPRQALLAFLFAVGGSISTALLNLWHPMPGNRRGMLRRHAQSKLIGLVEHVLAILWAIGAVLALVGSELWPFPIALAVLVLAGGQFGMLRTRIVGRLRPKPA